MKDMNIDEVRNLGETVFGEDNLKKVKRSPLGYRDLKEGRVFRTKYEFEGTTMVVRDYYRGGDHLWALESVEVNHDDQEVANQDPRAVFA